MTTIQASERDRLAKVIESGYGDDPTDCPYDHAPAIADVVLAAGYRQIFDGDCGLSGITAPDDRAAAEAWMRWANLVNIPEDGNGIAAMKQMLTELGYRKPRTVTTAEDLDKLPFEAVIRDAEGHVLERWGDAEHVQWSTPGCKWFVPATEIVLPVTVLYEVQP